MSLVTDTQKMIDDSGVFFPHQHLYDALNEAQLEIFAETRHYVVVATSTVTASQEFLTVPSTVMIPQRIVRNNAEWWSTNRAMLERNNREWRAKAQAAPKWFVVFDGERFQMVPKPDATYTFEIWGVGFPPTEISAAAENPTFTTRNINKAIRYLAGAELTRNTRPDLSELWQGQALTAMLKAKRELRRRGGHNTLVLRPGTALTRAHEGHIDSGQTVQGVFSPIVD